LSLADLFGALHQPDDVQVSLMGGTAIALDKSFCAVDKDGLGMGGVH